jgi:dihydroorotate dehydrogenase electron transfer subunit
MNRSIHLAKRWAEVQQVEILGPAAAGLGRVELAGEGIGAGVEGGRFAMVEAVGRADCILKRPYSYFSADGTDRVGFLIKDMGVGSRSLLRARVGDRVELLGPFGNVYPAVEGPVWGVAGGVGAAPFGLLSAACSQVLLGTRSATEAGFAGALERRGVVVDLATDDGSAGFGGSVLRLLEHRLEAAPLPPRALFTCGPTAMMRAVAQLARQHRILCFASLEERMGCGYGVCRGCAHLDASGSWRCICVDGPVYDAATIFAATEPKDVGP